jgi:pimeloyl-ACP methyl ester carboxylesterase
MLAKLGAPIAGPVAAAIAGPLRDWGWTEDNFDLETARFMMRYGVEDLSRSLLREFARWYAAKRMSDRYDLFSFTDHLERVRVPMLVIAGSRDGLTPAHDIAQVAERLGSADKTFLVAGRKTGFAHDYSHVDLVLGSHSHVDIFPRIVEWLDAHRPVEDAPRRAARRSSIRAVRTPGAAPARAQESRPH